MLASPVTIQARQILDIVYPVGMVLMFNDGTDPNSKMHGQTWEKLPGGYALTTTNNTNGGDVSLTDAQNHKPGYSYQGGLPNITGQIGSVVYVTQNTTFGAFDLFWTGGSTVANGSWASTGYVDFDASRASDCYGAYQSKRVSVVADHYAVVAWKRTG